MAIYIYVDTHPPDVWHQKEIMLL